ncbi:hypothetical protein [Novisyntrophococcus fermenticellae]|uniref:hypothetical protein n=1 Tax=Novisyntrophococcus fermenticellae TaxID=2068655 RepID=UPI001E5E399C|nr:hypothetical protein [Novisyntrophococcus fermenticellae]
MAEEKIEKYFMDSFADGEELLSMEAKYVEVLRALFKEFSSDLHIELDQKFGVIDRRFDQMDQRLDQMDQRFDQMDQRLGQMDQKFDDKFETLNQKIDRRSEFLLNEIVRNSSC